MLTNQHDPKDTLETFQPVTVGIHVQEMKGFRKELILSLLAPNAFAEGDEKGDDEKDHDGKDENENKDKPKTMKRQSQTTDAKRKKPKLFPVS